MGKPLLNQTFDFPKKKNIKKIDDERGAGFANVKLSPLSSRKFADQGLINYA